MIFKMAMSLFEQPMIVKPPGSTFVFSHPPRFIISIFSICEATEVSRDFDKALPHQYRKRHLFSGLFITKQTPWP
jgi:hypothetical protein